MDVNRRRLLGSVGAAGVASLAGVSAFSSDAVAYTQSTTAGDGPMVRVDWRETYNGAVLDGGDETTDGPVLHIENAQPGDSGTLAFRVTGETGDGGARTTMTFALTADDENGRNEPERAAGDDTPDEGELAAALEVAVWYDTGTFGISGLGGCDGVRDPGEETLVEGSLRDVDAALADGVRLGGDCLEAGDGVCVGVSWSLPAATGNRVQSDRVETDLSFTVEPCGGGS